MNRALIEAARSAMADPVVEIVEQLARDRELFREAFSGLDLRETLQQMEAASRFPAITDHAALEYAERVAALNEQLSSSSKVFEDFARSQQSLVDQVGALGSSAGFVEEWRTALEREAEAARGAFASVTSLGGDFENAFEQLVRDLDSAAALPVLSEDGADLEEERAAIKLQVEELVNVVADQADGSGSFDAILKDLRAFLLKVDAKARPYVALVIREIIVHVFVVLLTQPMFQAEKCELDPATVVAVCGKTVAEEVNESVKLQRRIVKADVLRVRSGPSTESEIIGRLYIGQVVLVLEDGEDWIRVERSDPAAQAKVAGWVSAEFTEPF